MGDVQDVSAAWETEARQWIDWARTPGLDVHYEALNLPAFEALLPPPGRHTLDVGCGEGRLGRRLTEHGHRVTGVDSSPTMVAAAQALGGHSELVVADAAALPFDDDAFDLAVAFMTLQDTPEPGRVIAEVARVLEAGATLCVATVHPLNRSDGHAERYFETLRVTETVERGAHRMVFHGVDRPFEDYTEALAEHGFAIERLREPAPSPAAVAAHPALAAAARRPFFVHLRCRLAG